MTSGARIIGSILARSNSADRPIGRAQRHAENRRYASARRGDWARLSTLDDVGRSLLQLVAVSGFSAMLVPDVPADARLFESPAPWPWSATAIAIVIYAGFGWAAGLLIRVGALPATSGTVVIVTIARAVVALLWIRHVARSKLGGSWARPFGLTLIPIDLVIGLFAAVVTYYVQAWVAYSVFRALGPAAQSSAWQQLADSLGEPAFLAIAVTGICTAPLIEEVVFRAMLLRSLAGRVGSAAGVLVASAIFAAIHLTPAISWQSNLVTLLTIGIFGCSMCILARITNRLGPGLVAHTLTLLVSFAIIAGRA